ncbi:MAG: alpha-ketoglutarate-dependent dioxygenase AlkB [Pseudomonadota bacterium]|nr:alpha-ketoglutarate-dependent dioxygenase AlkB [Pseudomonadota bacterium]
MSLLFDDPLVAGLDYRPEFISREEEAELLERLEAMDLAPFRFHGWTGNRRTHSFGWRYDFDDASFRPTEPIPRWLNPLRDRAAALAGSDPGEIAHVLLARYDPGAGIGWHRDRPLFERVVGISLGSPATLRFRQRTSSGFRRASLRVEPRSAYLVSGEARHEWEHSIAPGEQLRFSITFRTLSEAGHRKASAQLESGEAFGDPAAGGQR